MEEKLQEVIKLLRGSINGTIEIEQTVPLIVKFNITPFMRTIYISVDPVLVENKGAETIAIGVKTNLRNFINNCVFKG